jgi:hypothetical protein
MSVKSHQWVSTVKIVLFLTAIFLVCCIEAYKTWATQPKMIQITMDIPAPWPPDWIPHPWLPGNEPDDPKEPELASCS